MYLKVLMQTGIKVIQKLNKNRIKWIGLQEIIPHDAKTINEDENQLNACITTMQQNIASLNNSQEYLDYCYLSEDDIRMMCESNDEALLVVTAPISTQINIEERDGNFVISLSGESEDITTRLIEKEHHTFEPVAPKLEDIQNLSNTTAVFGKS